MKHTHTPFKECGADRQQHMYTEGARKDQVCWRKIKKQKKKKKV